jgi:hypothetical protein
VAQRPGRAVVGAGLDAGAGHGGPEEHQGGQQRQPAPAQHVGVQMRRAEADVPLARDDADPQHPADHRAVQEGAVGPLVHPHDPREAGTHRLLAHPAQPQVGEEHDDDEHRGAGGDQCRLPCRQAHQREQDPEVGHQRPPGGTLARGAGQRPAEVLAEGQHQVGEHAEREQVHGQPAPAGESVAGHQPHDDRREVGERDHDAGRGRGEGGAGGR